MNDLQKYEAVNKTESLTELAKVILSFADENNTIQGRTRSFNASLMAKNCINFIALPPNVLTREYGIRQQAMYIKHYINL